MKTLRIFISGTVQGMIFRKYLEEKAKEIGIRGFVRQMEDGRVEILAEGIDDKVTRYLDLCKMGTVHAHVRKVVVENFNHQGFKDFKILRI